MRRAVKCLKRDGDVGGETLGRDGLAVLWLKKRRPRDAGHTDGGLRRESDAGAKRGTEAGRGSGAKEGLR